MNNTAGSPDDLYDHAMDAGEKGECARAAELLKAYLRACPQDADAWYDLGQFLCQLAQFGDAERALLQAEANICSEALAHVHVSLALLSTDRGRREEAESWYSKACQSDTLKEKGWLWILRGANQLRLGSPEGAEQCHRYAITCQDCDLDEAYANLGNALAAQGKYGEAETAFRMAVEIDPDNDKLRVGLRRVSNAEDLCQNIKKETEKGRGRFFREDGAG